MCPVSSQGRELVRKPSIFSIVGWIALGIGATLMLALAVGTIWPWLKAAGETVVTESNSTTLRNVGLLIGGGAAIGLAVWRAIMADRQTRATQRQAETSQHSLLNDRYQRGVEMMGSKVLPIRIGAIHALDLLAREYPESHYRQFRDLGCAFVRSPPFESEPGTGLKGIREDIDAAIQVLGRRTPEQLDIDSREEMLLPLWGVDLSNHNLSGLVLSRSVFLGAKFRHAFLLGSKLADTLCLDTDFSNAIMWGADLSGARLHGANLTQANLSGADLSRARLSNPHLDREYSFNDFEYLLYVETSTKCTGPNLTGARLFGANLENANLTGANLAGAEFGPQVDEEGDVNPPAYGLTQKQLDSAIADPTHRPPILNGLLDAKTRKPLVWKTKA